MRVIHAHRPEDLQVRFPTVLDDALERIGVLLEEVGEDVVLERPSRTRNISATAVRWAARLEVSLVVSKTTVST